jgi:hypothetical protein
VPQNPTRQAVRPDERSEYGMHIIPMHFRDASLGNLLADQNLCRKKNNAANMRKFCTQIKF